MMQDYIAGKNVDHYLSMLMKPGLEPATQLMLHGLLVEEFRMTAQRFANANPGVSVTIMDRSNGATHAVAEE